MFVVHSLTNNLGQRNALWPEKAREPKSPGHGRPAVLSGDTHDNRRSVIKRSLEDVVV
jgi:hypothetical protein